MLITYSGASERCYSPALLRHQSIWHRNIQSNLAGFKDNTQDSFLTGKMAIVLSHNLQWKCSLTNKVKQLHTKNISGAMYRILCIKVLCDDKVEYPIMQALHSVI